MKQSSAQRDTQRDQKQWKRAKVFIADNIETTPWNSQNLSDWKLMKTLDCTAEATVTCCETVLLGEAVDCTVKRLIAMSKNSENTQEVCAILVKHSVKQWNYVRVVDTYENALIVTNSLRARSVPFFARWHNHWTVKQLIGGSNNARHEKLVGNTQAFEKLNTIEKTVRYLIFLWDSETSVFWWNTHRLYETGKGARKRRSTG